MKLQHHLLHLAIQQVLLETLPRKVLHRTLINSDSRTGWSWNLASAYYVLASHLIELSLETNTLISGLQQQLIWPHYWLS